MCSLRMPPPGRAWAAPYWASDHGWLEAVEPSPRRRGRRGESPRARGRRGARAPGSGGCDGPAGRSSVSFVIAHPPPNVDKPPPGSSSERRWPSPHRAARDHPASVRPRCWSSRARREPARPPRSTATCGAWRGRAGPLPSPRGPAAPPSASRPQAQGTDGSRTMGLSLHVDLWSSVA